MELIEKKRIKTDWKRRLLDLGKMDEQDRVFVKQPITEINYTALFTLCNDWYALGFLEPVDWFSSVGV